MVTLTVKGNAVNVTSVEYVLDLREYYMFARIKTVIPIPIGEEVTFEFNSSKSQLVVRESHYQEPLYELKLITLEQNKTLQLLTEPFTGNANVDSLLSTLGVMANIKISTASTWWMLPSLNVQTLIKLLNKYAVIPNGGAPRFYIDMVGKVQVIDFCKNLNTEPSVLKGQVVDDYSTQDWQLQVPGKLSLFCSSVEDFEPIQDEQDPQGSTGSIFDIDTTGNFKNLVLQAYRNDFTWNKYTKRKLTVINVISGPHSVGESVTVSNIKGIIMAHIQPIPITDESATSIDIIACPE